MELGGLDHERVTVPAADGIAVQRADCGRRMLAANSYHSRVVVHFRANHQRVGGLHELVVVVVKIVEHRRAGAIAIHDAALAERPAFRPVEVSAPLVQPLTYALAEWDLAVGGIDDPRGSVLTLHTRELRARIDPEGVVTATSSQIGAGQRRALVELVIGALAHDLRMLSRLPLDLAWRNDGRRIARRSLQRSDSGVGQIGRAHV